MGLIPEVVDYLGAASAAGVIGSTAYAAVARLSSWMQTELEWDGRDVRRLPSESEAVVLAGLFADARGEWVPPSGPIAKQTVTVGRDMNAPAINRAG